jgi:WD40 repeat protein
MPHVFLSYARENKDFVRRLYDALCGGGCEIWVDWEGIPPTAEWLAEIRTAIESSDALLFVISPASAASDICRIELLHAIQHKKRIIPVVWQEVTSERLEPALTKLQWIHGRESDDSQATVQQIIRALSTDLEWVRTHTRLLVRAIEWSDRGHDSSLLLRGTDLKKAEDWLTQDGTKDPQPTDLQARYIAAGRKAARVRRRVLIGAITSGLAIAAVLAVLASLQRSEKERQRQIALGRQLVTQAELIFDQQPHLFERSIALAAESMARAPSLEAQQILQRGLDLLVTPIVTIQHASGVGALAFSANGQRLVGISTKVLRAIKMKDHLVGGSIWSLLTSGEPAANVWDVTTGKEISSFFLPGNRAGRTNSTVRSVAISPDGHWLAFGSENKITLWSVGTPDSTQLVHGDDSRGLLIEDILVFSHDSRKIATAVGDATVRIWEVTTGQELAQFASQGLVTAVAFSPDGEKLAISRGPDNGVHVTEFGVKAPPGSTHIWRLRDGGKLARITHPIVPSLLAFNPDGSLLATASNSDIQPKKGVARITFWNSETGRSLHTLDMKGGPGHIAFSSNGRYFAAAPFRDIFGLPGPGGDKAVRVWEVRSGHEVARFSERLATNAMAFSPDGYYLATGSGTLGSRANLAQVWELSSGREIARTAHKDTVRAVAFDPTGSTLATATEKGQLKIWSLANTRMIRRGKKGRPRLVSLSPNRQLRAEALTNGEVQITAVNRTALIARLKHAHEVEEMIFDDPGQRLATIDEYTVSVWEVTTGRLLAQYEHESTLDSVAFSLDPSRLVMVDGRIVYIWNFQSDEQPMSLKHNGSVNAIAFSADKRYLAAAVGDPVLWSEENSARLWEISTGKLVSYMDHPSRVTEIAFGPDGTTLSTACDDGAARVWKIRSGQEFARLKHGGSVEALAYSPDGRYLATGSVDRTARLWQMVNGHQSIRLEHDGPVMNAVFNQAGDYLATATIVGTVHVWSVTTGKEVARIAPPTLFSSRVEFSRDDRTIVAGRQEWTWRWQPQDLIKAACSRLKHGLTFDEWQQYMGDEPYRPVCSDLRKSLSENQISMRQ